MTTQTTDRLDLALAMAYLQKAIELASQMRLRVAVALVDRGGRLVAAARMDGVGHVNLEVAIRKANAAQTFGVPTRQIAESADADPRLTQAFAALGSELIVLPGGFPVTKVVTVLGGVGIAGGHYELDHQLGERLMASMAVAA